MSCEIDTGAEPMLLTSSEWLDVVGDLTDKEEGEILTLADGSPVSALYGTLELEWLNGPQLIDVLVPNMNSVEPAFLQPGRRDRRTNALLGRSLLKYCRLTIDYGRRTVAIASSEGLAA